MRTVRPAITILFTVSTLCLALATASAAPQSTAATAELGQSHFANSGNAAAQDAFQRGILLLHSFEFSDAARAFREAQEADPDFALAWWGEAMSYNHPLWGEQDLVAARRVLSHLGPGPAERVGRAATERERDYLRAAEALYGEGDKKSRDAAYSAIMERIATTYPDDLDGRALYALSLLGLSGTDRDVSNYMRGAAVAEEVYELNPRHPGALHYLIHAYDDPQHAPLGLRAARRYGKVAPAAAHAQHMPSHIFFALGMWDDAIGANIASLATSRSRGTGGYHALHWLEYAYLQKGRRQDAASLLDIVREDLAKKTQGGNAAFATTHMAMTCATWIVETGDPGPSICQSPLERGSIRSISPFAEHLFALGLLAAQNNEVRKAEDAVKQLDLLLSAGRAALGAGDAATRFEQVDPSEIRETEVMKGALTAAIQFRKGKKKEAVESAKKSAELSDSGVFEYGPPPGVKPPHELYGEILLALGRREEARAEFLKALARAPGRAKTLEGLRAAGNE